MIETEEYKHIPATVVHRLTAKTNTADVENGIAEATKVFHSVGKKYGKLNLIINTKGLIFTDLKAHKTWSQWLKTTPAIKKKIDFAIFVTDELPNARAEKEIMETEKRRFFFDFAEGINWLKDKICV